MFSLSPANVWLVRLGVAQDGKNEPRNLKIWSHSSPIQTHTALPPSLQEMAAVFYIGTRTVLLVMEHTHQIGLTTRLPATHSLTWSSFSRQTEHSFWPQRTRSLAQQVRQEGWSQDPTAQAEDSWQHKLQTVDPPLDIFFWQRRSLISLNGNTKMRPRWRSIYL